MRDLIGVHVGGMIKDEEEVFLCLVLSSKLNDASIVTLF